MVYQFLTDLLIFHTNFSILQYWGIFISATTFVVDVCMTWKEVDEKPEVDKDKKEDEHLIRDKEVADESIIEM